MRNHVLAKIDHMSVQGWITHLGNHLAPATLVQCRRLMSGVLRSALRNRRFSCERTTGSDRSPPAVDQRDPNDALRLAGVHRDAREMGVSSSWPSTSRWPTAAAGYPAALPESGEPLTVSIAGVEPGEANPAAFLRHLAAPLSALADQLAADGDTTSAVSIWAESGELPPAAQALLLAARSSWRLARTQTAEASSDLVAAARLASLDPPLADAQLTLDHAEAETALDRPPIDGYGHRMSGWPAPPSRTTSPEPPPSSRAPGTPEPGPRPSAPS